MRNLWVLAICFVMFPMLAAAQSCDALSQGVGFCAEGGMWEAAPDNGDPTITTYFASDMVLHISIAKMPEGTVIRQDKLRQLLNKNSEDNHLAKTGKRIRYWIEDELYIDDTLANRTVYMTDYSNGPATYAETMVMRDGWYLVALTAEAGTEFSNRHMEAHEDALGRITLY